ncbi:MAG: hypothetical protein KIT17_08290 [Rubrivivax sp.]|nr:hypothetical protein [Rubrivivax sp.]
MSFIYLLALVAVGAAIAAITLDSVLLVARKPRWAEPTARPSLHVVPAAERRTQALPYVGVDRRRPIVEAEEEVKATRAA